MNRYVKELTDDGFTVTFSKHPDKIGGGWFYLCKVDKQVKVDEFIEDGFIAKHPEEAARAAWKRYIGGSVQ